MTFELGTVGLKDSGRHSLQDRCPPGPSSCARATDSPSLGGSQPLFHTAGQPGVDSPSPSLMPASAQAQNAQRALSSVVLPSQGPGGGSELSSAHQLQQIAAKQSVSRCSRTRSRLPQHPLRPDVHVAADRPQPIVP